MISEKAWQRYVFARSFFFKFNVFDSPFLIPLLIKLNRRLKGSVEGWRLEA